MVLSAAALACLLFTLKVFISEPAHTPDFAEFYTAGTILREGAGNALFDVALQRKVEHGFLGGGRFFPLDHPPFEAYLFLPLSKFSYRDAFSIWSFFNLIVLALTLFSLRYTNRRLHATNLLAWVAVWLVPVAEALAIGQDSIPLALIFLLAFLSLKRRRDFSAGMILGLGLYRFEIVLPFLFVFALRLRRRVLAGFLVLGSVLFLLSVAAVGLGGLREYVHVLLAVGRPGGSRTNGVFLSSMLSLRAAIVAFASGSMRGLALFLVTLLGTICVLGYAARKFNSISHPESRAFDLQFSLAAIAALLASYHLYAYELTPMIVVAFLVLAYEQDVQRPGGNDLWKSLSLLLLCFLMAIGPGISVHQVNLDFFILVGMAVWLATEISELRRSSLGGEGPEVRQALP